MDKQSLSEEISVGVTYSSLMSAVALFFTGMLISQYDSFNESIKVPLVFLIISTFSFIFAATIYTNAGTEITLNKLRVVEKYMVYAKNLMELLGLYPFILATPLVIGAVTHDNFVRFVTMTVTIVGFALYSQSKFSILEKELSKSKKRVLSLIILALTLCLYYYQSSRVENAVILYSSFAVLLMLVMTGAAYFFCTRSTQYKATYFRQFKDADAVELSEVVMRNLKHVKTKHVSKEKLKKMREYYSPEALASIADQKQIIVAEFNERLVGLAILAGNQIESVFTDPSVQRKGIGRQLIEMVEAEAVENGFKYTVVIVNDVDRNFYMRMGYQPFEDAEHSTPNLMKKDIA